MDLLSLCVALLLGRDTDPGDWLPVSPLDWRLKPPSLWIPYFSRQWVRVSPDPGSLSQGCWQEKLGPASVFVTVRFAREVTLVSRQGFSILLMP